MNNEQNQKKELKKLPGFYIALCSCVLVIGLAGYITERRSENTANISHELSENDSVFSGSIDSHTDDAISRNAVPESETVTREEYDSEVSENSQPADAPQAADAGTAGSADTAPVLSAENSEPEEVYSEPVISYAGEYEADNSEAQSAATIVSAKSVDFKPPVNGDILEGFSEKLVYNSALADWRAHDGIDLAADVGCSVNAAANGTVSKIFSSALGEGIEIEHADGYMTRYTCLKSIESLNEGDNVAMGDVIGLVGESKGETVTEPHLHFEVYKDGESVNPEDYIK